VNLTQIEALFRRLVDEQYADGQLGGDARPVFRGGFRALEALSDLRTRRTQGSYLRDHGTATGEPATFGRRAAFTVTLEREGNRDLALFIAAGKMTMEGPSGRLYVNVEDIVFRKRDPDTERSVRFECVVPGEAGNLGFLINDDLVSPSGTVPAEYVALANQSRGRANKDAISEPYGGASAIKDSGIPATFESSDEGLYVEVLNSSAADNLGRMLRIREHVWPGIEEPAGSNIRPTIAVLDDKAVREDLLGAKLDDGGVFTTFTDEVNDPAAGTATLLPAVPVVGDAFYFGSPRPVSELFITLDTAAAGDFSITWEYWNGFSWLTQADQVDETQGLTVAGTRRVTWPDVTGPVPSTVDGVNAYWYRARVSAFVSLTAQPVASYAYPLTWQPLSADLGDLEWAVRDWKDLGFAITACRQIETGREDDLYFHGDQRGMYRVEGETEDAFRSRLSRKPDVVSPKALQRVTNRILAPLGLKGVVFDIGDTFDGFYFDVDAFDYYQPGDAYPLSPWKLLLSLNEKYGFFYVRVPWIAAGDFGIFYDAGPNLYLPDLGLYIGSAFDEGFFDGVSTSGQTIYRSLYEEIRRRKGGGIGFALIPDSELNTP
jgi:hypothetical protein